jgi:hypothetical protein
MYSMLGIFCRGLNRSSVDSLAPCWTIEAERNSPPDVVYYPSLDVCEPFCVSKHFDYGRCPKAMPGHSHFLDVKSVLPLTPIDTFQASRRATNVAFSAQILSCNLLSLTVTNSLEYAISFFELTQTHFDLGAAKFGVDAALVVRCGIHRIVLGEDVILSLSAMYILFISHLGPKARNTHHVMITLRNLLFGVIQLLELVEFLLALRIPIAIYLVCLGPSMSILLILLSPLMVYKRSGPAAVPMLYGAHNKAVTRKLGAQSAVCSP